MFLLQYHYRTVEPWFNKPLYNKILSVMNDALQPGQSYSKMYRKEPWYNEPRYNKILVTMNTTQKPKHLTYPKCKQTNVNNVSFQMWPDQQESKSVIWLFLCLPVSLPLKFVLLALKQGAVAMNRPVQCTVASYRH